MTPEEKVAQERANREKQALLLLLLLLRDNFGAQMAPFVQTVAGDPTSYLGGVSDELLAKLVDAHAHAWYLGRMMAGDLAPFNAVDVQAGRALAFGQIPYLSDFLSKAASGGYINNDGTLSIATIEYRAAKFGKALVGTANRGWAGSMPDNTIFTWHKTALESCYQCVSYNGQQYTIDTLPGFPGDGHTVCNTNCKCYLTTDSGLTSFIVED